jgi:hypothetical protein
LGLIFFGQGQTPVTGGVPGPGGQGGPVVGGGSDKGSPFSRPTPTPAPAPTPRGSEDDGDKSGKDVKGGFDPTGDPKGEQTGPITGVYCKSQAKSIRVYQGRDEYHLLRFTEQTLYDGGRWRRRRQRPGIGGGGVMPPGGGGTGPREVDRRASYMFGAPMRPS